MDSMKKCPKCKANMKKGIAKYAWGEKVKVIICTNEKCGYGESK